MQDEHLRLARQRSTWQSDEFDDALPSDLMLPNGDDAYTAHGRPSAKPVYTLHVLLEKGRVRSFEYVHLDSNSEFVRLADGQNITVRFCGSQTLELRITGRNLWRLFDYIHQHRMPWIRLAERDFAADKEPIITAMEIISLDGG